MPQTDIGIDMGTCNLRVYLKNRDVMIREPSLVTYDKDSDEIVAFGEEARQNILHASGNIVAIRPLRQGVIFDYSVTEAMLKHFIVKATGRRAFRKPTISVCIPPGVTSIEKRAVEEAIYQAGARKVTFVDQTVAAAIGAGIDITKPVGNMIVDIGGGTTDIGVISVGDTVIRESVSFAGSTFTEVIVRAIRRTHGLFIDEGKAEEIKCRIGNCYKRTNPESMEVSGRNVINGLPESININSEEIRLAMEDVSGKLTEAVHGVLEKTPPELAADIVERGIILTGGGARLSGLEELIGERTGINVMTADEPELCCARGTGLYTEMMEELERSL